MPKKNRDDLFRQIASDYVDNWGESLLQEREELTRENTVPLTPRMDRKVLGQAAARKRRRNLRAAGALAACLLLAVLLPRMGSLDGGSSAAPSAEMAAERPAENAAFALPQDAAPEAGEGKADAEEHLALPQAAPEAAAAEEGPSPSAPQDAPPAFVQGQQDLAIPLPFVLPEHLTVLSVAQEEEKTIYHLSSTTSDEVVLTLESTTRAPDTQGLTPLSINGEIVFTSADPEHPFLTFQKNGALYEMTCSSGLDALIDLSRWIL